MQKKDTGIVSECNVDCSTAPQAKILVFNKKIAVLTAFQHQKSSLFKLAKPSFHCYTYMMITV